MVFSGDRETRSSSHGSALGADGCPGAKSGRAAARIGRRLARKLDWQVYDQEMLEYMAQDTVVRQGVFDALSPAATEWVETHLEKLLREQNLSQQPSIENLARVDSARSARRVKWS